jgi:8-oxo-dGTP diphosphatase
MTDLDDESTDGRVGSDTEGVDGRVGSDTEGVDGRVGSDTEGVDGRVGSDPEGTDGRVGSDSDRTAVESGEPPGDEAPVASHDVDPGHFTGDPTPRTLGFDGYAAATDPRNSFQDLIERTTEEVHDRAAYRELATMEAYLSGWVATALTLDDAGRVLLVQHEDADHWAAPGGTLAPGETLEAGLRREIEEETGVAVEPTRPHAVTDATSRNDDSPSEERTGFRVVTFGARATGAVTPIPDAGIESGSEIADARWFESLPENTFGGEVTATILERELSN